jgi:hypothetical protein
MAHDPLFWVMAVGLVLAVVIVGGGWARMREQRHHVRELLRDTSATGAEARPFRVAARRHIRSSPRGDEPPL